MEKEPCRARSWGTSCGWWGAVNSKGNRSCGEDGWRCTCSRSCGRKLWETRLWSSACISDTENPCPARPTVQRRLLFQHDLMLPPPPRLGMAIALVSPEMASPPRGQQPPLKLPPYLSMRVEILSLSLSLSLSLYIYIYMWLYLSLCLRGNHQLVWIWNWNVRAEEREEEEEEEEWEWGPLFKLWGWEPPTGSGSALPKFCFILAFKIFTFASIYLISIVYFRQVEQH